MSSEHQAPQPSGESKERTFEESLKQLESIIDRLENEAPPLEDALTAYEEGTELARQCIQRLEQAELRIRSLKLEE
jgi:exodeoxyribonuclease VII small subunit